ncbi:MAG TPA: zf-HC2 domain-containing protein [Actinomycetes bacterium]|nr:zf-HC2 domain-containing protein [Actinomycetes bacterium]
MTHLGDRIAALADGELDHPARDRALAHVAHCASCRRELEAQRAVKETLSAAPSPLLATTTLDSLRGLADLGGPVPPRARTMPQGPLVPELPAPGRRPRGARRDSRRPGDRVRRRAGVMTAGALSVAGLVLGTAFVAGGAQSTTPVAPPVAELSVEHGRTSTAVTVGDPTSGLMTSFDPALTTRR